MTPHKQINKHDPENGVIGDCFRTVIACILDLKPLDIPHFALSETRFMADAQEWCRVHGVGLVEFRAGADLEPLMEHMSEYHAYWILVGESSNHVDHVVVCYAGEIVHDPALDDSGIIGPTIHDGHYWIGILSPQNFDINLKRTMQ